MTAPLQSGDRRRQILGWVLSSLVFFAVPILLGLAGLRARLDDRAGLAAEEVFSRQEQVIHLLRTKEDTGQWLQFLIDNLTERTFLKFDPHRFARGIYDLRKRFPGSIQVYLVDADGEVNPALSEPDAPRFVLKSLYQDAAAFCLRGNPEPLQSRWRRYRTFVGREIEHQQFRKKHRELFIANSGEATQWFYYAITPHGGVFIRVIQSPDWEYRGMKDRVRAYLRHQNNHHVNIGVTVPGTILPSGYASRAIMAFHRTSDERHFVQNTQVTVTRLNSSALLWIASPTRTPWVDDLQRLCLPFLGTLLFAILSMLSYVVIITGRQVFFSIKWRLVTLFFYAGLLPLLVIFTVSWDYLRKEYDVQMANRVRVAEQTLRLIDQRFPLMRRAVERKLQQDLAGVRYASEGDRIKARRLFQVMSKRIQADDFQLFNRSGKLEFSYSAAKSNPRGGKGGRMAGMVMKSFIPYLNNEETDLKTTMQTDFLQSFGGVNLMSHMARGLKKLSDFRFDATRGWFFFLPLENFEKQVSHILSIYWQTDDLERSYVTRQIRRRKHIPPGIDVAAGSLENNWMVSPSPRINRIVRSFIRGIESRQSNINRKFFSRGSTFFLTGIKPKELQTCVFLAIQQDHPVKQKVQAMENRLLTFAGMCIFISVFLGMVLSRKILTPIAHLSAGVHAVDHKCFEFRLPVLGRDEFGNLAELFNNMIENLEEVESAQKIQQRLFPASPLTLGEYRVFGQSRPASRLGGDYFDYLAIDERYLLAIIGDVTGHGIPAALLMAMAKGIVLDRARAGTPLPEVIEILNHTIFYSLAGKLLMSAGLLLIDVQTHKATAYNCGHLFPFLRHVDGTMSYIAAQGTQLGARKSIRFKPNEFTLQPGERVIYYTDGLVESLVGHDERSLFHHFQEYLETRPMIDIEGACDDYLNNHEFMKSGKPQPDDFTILLIDRAATPLEA